MFLLLFLNTILILKFGYCLQPTQMQIPVPVPTGCCGPNFFWPHGPSPGDPCDPDPRCGSPFDNYERVGCKMCCKKAGDMFDQYYVDLTYRSWVVIASDLIADDDCGHFMMCELACLDATQPNQPDHHTFPATYNDDTKDIIDYVNAFVNGYNNVSKTGSCLPGC